MVVCLLIQDVSSLPNLYKACFKGSKCMNTGEARKKKCGKLGQNGGPAVHYSACMNSASTLNFLMEVRTAFLFKTTFQQSFKKQFKNTGSPFK